MSIIEKILLAILIILLPIGIFFSHYFLTKNETNEEIVEIDGEKLRVMVENFGKMEKEISKTKKQFVVSSVSYASESGELTIKGTAPSPLMSVMMSASLIPPENPDNEENLLGTFLGNYSVLVKKDGKFSVNLPIKKPSNLIEVRLEQDEVIRTVRYDFSKKLQIL